MAKDDGTKGGLPTGTQLTALDERFREDPYSVLRQLRERDPVHEDLELKRWFVTDHDIVRTVLRGAEYCVDARKAAADSFARKIAATGEDARPSMLGLDDPDHRRLRSFVSRAFAPDRIEAMRPEIERIVAEVLGGLRQRPGFDVVAEFAAPIPFLALAGMLGVRAAELPEFRAWADAKVREFDPFRSAADAAAIAQAERGLRAYFGRAIAERRAAPRDDLVTDLVRANENGESLSEDEIVTMCNLLIVAGIVTTTDLIGNGVLALLRHPEQCAQLRANPALIEAAVEEMLRFDSPVIQTGRIASRDMRIGGHRVAAGASISLSLGAANHDPRVYRDPHRFDIGRADTHHQSFGGGVHLCLGHALARLETQIAVLRLLEAFPRLRLASGPVARKRLPVLHGCCELRVLTG
jgi:cytochrome P450